MYLTSLRFYNFRNLLDSKISCSPEVNVVVGRNGQGKTNFIEGVQLLSTTRSFRTSKIKELIRWGESEASVIGELQNPEITGQENATQLLVTLSNKKREAYIDGNKLNSLANYVGRFLAVSFSPSDLSLVKGAPLTRRNFLDRHISEYSPENLCHFLEYNKTLSMKSTLLREGRANKRQLDVLNELIAKQTQKILELRTEFLSRLEEVANRHYQQFCLEDGPIELSLECSHGRDVLGEEAIVRKLGEVMEREILYKSALIGPHRDEITILLQKRDSRAFSSQGQCRSIVLSLKLAVVDLLREKRQSSPVILLDDVDSELDEQRRGALLELVLGSQSQIFITGTDLNLNSSQRQIQHLRVQEGGVLEEGGNSS